MSDGFLDDLARRLAEPMPRGKALRVLGGTLAGLAFGGAASRTAHADEGYERVACGSDPFSGTVYCVGDKCCDPRRHHCCSKGYACCGDGCCQEKDERGIRYACVNGDCKPTTCPNGVPFCGELKVGGISLGPRCCAPGQTCCDPRTGLCCPRTHDCVDRICRERCPAGRVRCGKTCCPKGQRCVGGKCRTCPSGQKACGKKCCPKGQDCCWDDKGNYVCCNTKKRSCVNVGKPGATKMTCCAEGHTGASVLGLSPSGMTTGIEKDAERVCCPKRRFVPRPRACCPPGYTSMEGKLVLPAFGGGGLCCRDDKACGSGPNITCCSTGVTPLGEPLPQFEEFCVNGACVRRSA